MSLLGLLLWCLLVLRVCDGGSSLAPRAWGTTLEISAEDERFMLRALELASQGLGKTHPNPAVGCVLVKDGVIVGEGYHERAGQPHAEAMALLDAQNRAQNASVVAGATAYVTLEPCNHFGRTPPCSQALVRAGIARVVAGLQDPDPRVSGGGLRFLQEHNVAVSLLPETDNDTDEERPGGLAALSRQCRRLNRPFVWRVRTGRASCVALCRLEEGGDGGGGESGGAGAGLGAGLHVAAMTAEALVAGLKASPEGDCLVVTPAQLLAWGSGHGPLAELPAHLSLAVYGQADEGDALERCAALLRSVGRPGQCFHCLPSDSSAAAGAGPSPAGVLRHAALSPSRLLELLAGLGSNAAVWCCDSQAAVEGLVRGGAGQRVVCLWGRWDGRDGGVEGRVAARVWLRGLAPGEPEPGSQEHKGEGYYAMDM